MQCFVVSGDGKVSLGGYSQLSSLDITCCLTIMAVSLSIAVCDFT